MILTAKSAATYCSIYCSRIIAGTFVRRFPSPFASATFFSTATNQAKRPRIVIVGSGWGGNTLARRLDKNRYDVRLISPANHFLFTPLLPSTAVGTLEFRAIQEPVRTIQGLGEYYQAKARSFDTENQVTKRIRLGFEKEAFSLQLLTAYFHGLPSC